MPKQTLEEKFLFLIGIPESEINSQNAKQDAFPTYKERVTLQPGIQAWITHDKGDRRHNGWMSAKYGLVAGTKGMASDSPHKSIDIYLGDNPDSSELFKVWQVNPNTGDFDEYKYIAHCRVKAEARELYLRHGGRDRFGLIQSADWEEIRPKKFDKQDAEDDYAVPEDAEDVDLPEDITIDWVDAVPTEYSSILEAKDADDKTLAATVATSILLAEWLFSEKKGTYLKPAKKGQKREELTPDELTQIAEDRINTAKIRLDGINRRCSKQEQFEDEWFDSAWSEVEQLHSQLFVLGRGGLERMNKRDRALLQSILRFQKYHLSTFLSDLMTTEVSEKQLFNRLRMYANSARATYRNAQLQQAKAKGATEARRVLDPIEHEVCPECQEYSDRGWVPIDRVVPISVGCSCRSNCRCSIQIR